MATGADAPTGPDLLLKHASNDVVDVALRRLFTTYTDPTSNVNALTSAKFSKLWRDAGFIGHGLTSVDVDLVFVRVAQGGPPAGRAAVSGVAARTSLARVAGGLAGSKKKVLNFGQFLETVYAFACLLAGDGRPNAPANGRRGLLLLLVERLLPLSERIGGSGDAGDAPIGEEEIVSRASVLQVVFAHYSATVRVEAAATGAAPLFWAELDAERLALSQSDPAIAADAATTATTTSGGARGATSALDLGSWQKLMSHFGVCPTLLSKAEIGRIFQIEGLRAAPANHLTFAQFAHALGARALAVSTSGCLHLWLSARCGLFTVAELTLPGWSPSCILQEPSHW